MPRLSSLLPRYRKHASGQAFVYLDGRNIYLGPYGTQRSRQEYDRVISEWTANGRRLPSVNGGTSVAELCAAYLKHAKAYYPGKTLQTRILNALRLLNKLYGRKPANDFGPLGLKAIRQVMVKTGVSRRYVNDTTAELKRIFKWGASEELVSHDVFHKLQTVSGLAKGRTEAREPDPICPVTDDDINKTLEHLTPIVQSMVRLQRLTGIRPDELCSMRPTDIDRTGNVWVYRPPHHKTQYRGRLREVAIGPRAQEVLMPYLLRAPALG